MGIEEEIEEIQEEIRETPYNKSTEAHIGRLKAKLAELKEKREAQQAGSGGGPGYAVEKTGDATVALVGFPSVGKSTLLNALTNADSEVGAYEFTTLDVNPGMLQYRGANIQLLDVPGLIEGAAGGRGGGKEVLSVVRTADLVVFVLSVFEIDQYERLHDELYKNGIRLDTEPPRVSVRTKAKDGISVTASVDLDLDEETIAGVLREHGYVNADVTIGEQVDLDELRPVTDRPDQRVRDRADVEVLGRVLVLDGDVRREAIDGVREPFEFVRVAMEGPQDQRRVRPATLLVYRLDQPPDDGRFVDLYLALADDEREVVHLRQRLFEHSLVAFGDGRPEAVVVERDRPPRAVVVLELVDPDGDRHVEFVGQFEVALLAADLADLREFVGRSALGLDGDVVEAQLCAPPDQVRVDTPAVEREGSILHSIRSAPGGINPGTVEPIGGRGTDSTAGPGA